jgi:hypothetical protein
LFEKQQEYIPFTILRFYPIRLPFVQDASLFQAVTVGRFHVAEAAFLDHLAQSRASAQQAFRCMGMSALLSAS